LGLSLDRPLCRPCRRRLSGLGRYRRPYRHSAARNFHRHHHRHDRGAAFRASRAPEDTLMSAMVPPRHLVVRSPAQRVALRLPLRALVVLALLAAALLVLTVLSLATGSYGVAPGEIWETLRGMTVSRAIDNVVWEFRFPRTLAAAL